MKTILIILLTVLFLNASYGQVKNKNRIIHIKNNTYLYGQNFMKLRDLKPVFFAKQISL